MIAKKEETPAKTASKTIQSAVDKTDYSKTIESHKQAAAHHLEAAKHNLDAVKHYEIGNYEKAAHSTLLASGHHTIAGEFISDDAKHHAQALKVTHYHS